MGLSIGDKVKFDSSGHIVYTVLDINTDKLNHQVLFGWHDGVMDHTVWFGHLLDLNNRIDLGLISIVSRGDVLSPLKKVKKFNL